MKFLFAPVGIISGLIAGQIGKKIFDQIWGVIEDFEPPKPNTRNATWAKVLLAAAVQGAIFKVTRAAVDRSTRRGFESLTGTWPGEEQPERE
jgi:Protein of unknown function (DUF4235)